jgi:predicted RNA binding protein YcfA (HicA-like mRNA interferase family)
MRYHCEVPPKLRELEARLKRAGFARQAARGSHRKWVHPTGRYVVLSGGAGDDARKYQEVQVQDAIDEANRRAKAE